MILFNDYFKMGSTHQRVLAAPRASRGTTVLKEFVPIERINIREMVGLTSDRINQCIVGLIPHVIASGRNRRRSTLFTATGKDQ
jgi:hypothetical protein